MNPQSSQVIKSINQKLPTDNSPQSKKKMEAYWPQFDKNKNGYLSLAEIDRGVKYVIKLPDLFPLAPMIKRGFNATKAKMKAMTKYGDDYVSKAQFPYLLQYIKNYYIYWAIFNDLDKNHDKKLSLEQFNKAKPMFEATGIPVPDVKQLFNTIDKDKGGYIEFDEFCHWILLNRHKFDL